MNKKALLLLAVVLLLVAGAGIALASFLPADGRIARRVVVAGMDVGGLTKQEAESGLAPVLEARLDKEIAWRYEERSWRFKLRELGIGSDLDAALDEAMQVGRQGSFVERVRQLLEAARSPVGIDPSLSLDQKTAAEALQHLEQAARREPADARLALDGDEVILHPHKSGTELDMEGVRSQLEEIVRTGKSGEYPLPVKLQQPQVTTDELSGFECVLGGYSTSFASSSADRSHNIAVAAEALNGSIIPPGATFSFNAVVGPRSTEQGYKTAPTYQQGRVVPGVGGGVCQVSSTTYNAFLLAGFDIVQRSNHDMLVHYLPAGRDATVVYGAIDLKVRNPYPSSTYLMAGVTGKTVSVKVLGRRADKLEVSISTEVTGTFPFSIIEKEDSSLPPGKKKVDQKGSNGRKSVAYRRIKAPGQPEKVELLSRDFYRPMNKIILIGPKTPKAKPPAAVEEKAPVSTEATVSEGKATPAPRKAASATGKSADLD